MQVNESTLITFTLEIADQPTREETRTVGEWTGLTDKEQAKRADMWFDKVAADMWEGPLTNALSTWKNGLVYTKWAEG